MLWKYLRIALELYLSGLGLLAPAVLLSIMRLGSRTARREEDKRRFDGAKLIYRS
jgi:hypothetical protein